MGAAQAFLGLPEISRADYLSGLVREGEGGGEIFGELVPLDAVTCNARPRHPEAALDSSGPRG